MTMQGSGSVYKMVVYIIRCLMHLYMLVQKYAALLLLAILTLLHSEWPIVYGVLAILSAIGLMEGY